MLALAHVAAGLGQLPWAADAEAPLADAAGAVLADLSAVDDVVAVLDRPQTVHMGRGYSLAVALESALKFKETTLRPAQGYATGDFLHGPVAAVDPEDAVVGYAAGGPAFSDVTGVLESLHGRSVPTVVVTDRPDEMGPGIPALGVPAGLPEPLVSLLLTVRAQQLARTLTLRSGLDPDRPEGLSKVTVTH
jgi:glucosamine--fructose-6-phosphate aminotransferase (isomerizing)